MRFPRPAAILAVFLFVLSGLAGAFVGGDLPAGSVPSGVLGGGAFHPVPFTGPTISAYRAVGSNLTTSLSVTVALGLHPVGSMVVIACGTGTQLSGTNHLNASDNFGDTYTLAAGPKQGSGVYYPADVFTTLVSSSNSFVGTCAYSGGNTQMSMVMVNIPSGTVANATTCNVPTVKGPVCTVFSKNSANYDLGFATILRPTGTYAHDPWTFITGTQSAVLDTGLVMNADYNATGAPNGANDRWNWTSPNSLNGTMAVISVTASVPALHASLVASSTSTGTGTTLTFKGNETGGLLPYTSYAWKFGDGGTASTRNTTHSYSTQGTFLVNYTVEDSAFQFASAYTNVTVVGAMTSSLLVNGPGGLISQPNAPQAEAAACYTVHPKSVTGATNSCALTFINLLSFGHANYSILVTLTNQSGTVYTHTTSGLTTSKAVNYTVGTALNASYKAGNFSLLTHISDSVSGQWSNTTVFFDVAYLLHSVLTPSTSSAEVGFSLQFTSASTGGFGAYSYSWVFNDPPSGTRVGNPVVHKFTTNHNINNGSDVFLVTVTLTDANGKVAMGYTNVTILPGMVTSLTAYNGSSNIGAGGTCYGGTGLDFCLVQFLNTLSFGTSQWHYKYTLTLNGTTQNTHSFVSSTTAAVNNTAGVIYNGSYHVGVWKLWFNVTDTNGAGAALNTSVSFTVAAGAQPPPPPPPAPPAPIILTSTDYIIAAIVLALVVGIALAVFYGRKAGRGPRRSKVMRSP